MTTESKGALEEAYIAIGRAVFELGDGVQKIEKAKSGMEPGTYKSLSFQNRIKELVEEQEAIEKTLLELGAMMPK